MSSNVPGVSDVPVPEGPGAMFARILLPAYFKVTTANIVTEGMSQRVARTLGVHGNRLLFILYFTVAIQCY